MHDTDTQLALINSMREEMIKYKWTLTDSEVEAWLGHLQVGAYFFSDFRKAIFDWTHSHEKGCYKPTFVQLKPLLLKHKHDRDGVHGPAHDNSEYEPTDEGLAAIARIRNMVDRSQSVEVTRELELKMYDELRGLVPINYCTMYWQSLVEEYPGPVGASA